MRERELDLIVGEDMQVCACCLAVGSSPLYVPLPSGRKGGLHCVVMCAVGGMEKGGLDDEREKRREGANI